MDLDVCLFVSFCRSSSFQPSGLDARDELGLTPLLLAVSFREAKDAVKTLIEECGARMDDRDHESRSAVYIAAKYNAVTTLEVRPIRKEKNLSAVSICWKDCRMKTKRITERRMEFFLKW